MDNQILANTKYNCTYHIVFIPKYRRKVMYGKIGKEVGEILSTVCRITGVELIKGGVCPNLRGSQVPEVSEILPIGSTEKGVA